MIRAAHRHRHRHQHQHQHQHGGRSPRRRLGYTLALTVSIMIAEAVGGHVSGSLALLADAGHMLTDALALLVAFAAITLSAKPADDRRTFGYRRLEVLAALLNGVALVIVSAAISTEAMQRWVVPRPVDAPTMGAVAAIGLIANGMGLWLLRGSRGNINVRGAFLHVLSDTLSSVGVLAASGIIALTGWTRVDAIVSFAIAIIIVIGSVALLREVVDVLLESAPADIDTEKVRQTIAAVDGVEQIHDLHIWCITSGLTALSAHVIVPNGDMDTHHVLLDIRRRLREAHGIDHSTLQIEREAETDCGC